MWDGNHCCSWCHFLDPAQGAARDDENAVILAHGQAGSGVGSNGASALAVAGVVWGEPARPSLAAQPGSLRDLGVGNHAAADAGGRGGGALQGVHESVSDVDFAGTCAETGCVGTLERPGLLPAGSDV